MERFDRFFARANAAYYAARNPFADFTTAPEISQVFGEVLGGWARVVWGMMGEPADAILVEAGPGRGTLMADAKRVWPAARVHFIETSERLRAAQRLRVPDAVWHDDLDDVPEKPMILLANEFLDALPVRQFVRREDGWRERYVADGAFAEQAADRNLPDDPIGSVREVNEAAASFVTKLVKRRAVALFIDYGPMRSEAGDSVQAIRDGKPSDKLADPGMADLTAHVDFAALAVAAQAAGGAAQGPVPQNNFLTALGFWQRNAALKHAVPARAAALQLAADRLTAPEAMGSLFKAFAVCPERFPALPGFEP